MAAGRGVVHAVCDLAQTLPHGPVRFRGRVEGARFRAALPAPRSEIVLYTIAVVLLILWLLGLVTSYTLGGFIHLLLVVAVVMVLVNLISGRRSV
jgi:hypothetical protein